MDPNFLNSISSIVPRPKFSSDYASTITVRRLPFIGRVHIVNDLCGIVQVGFVMAYWVYGTFCTLNMVLLPRYNDGLVSILIIAGYLFISLMCLLSLIKASITNPGRIPLASEETTSDTSEWTFCDKCLRKRPPRSHHCRRCQQCVLRMDHHCPWINNCVGEENHYSFMLLLFYAFMLSSCTLTFCIMHFWWWPECQSCDHDSFFMRHSKALLYILIALAVNMALTMFCQLGNHHFNLLQDRTTLDHMKLAQCSDHSKSKDDEPEMKMRKTYPAYRELCGQGGILCWLWPCRHRSPVFQSYASSAV